MTSIKTIANRINSITKSVALHQDYSKKPGLYALMLCENSSLKSFGDGKRIIYVGKAKGSLKKRDLDTHFKDGKTGSSSLRRSIGAILKKELGALAFSRNGSVKFPNIDNYKFDTETEKKLSQWMNKNLLIGFWEYNSALEEKPLRKIEEQLTLILKPTLDLSNATKKFNSHAVQLTTLRKICKDEARQNVLNEIPYY
ncbi:MAG: GIY-YIG nuclease family protein [Chitinophagaceae bacterium]